MVTERSLKTKLIFGVGLEVGIWFLSLGPLQKFKHREPNTNVKMNSEAQMQKSESVDPGATPGMTEVLGF
jgi:hypothetical protein